MKNKVVNLFKKSQQKICNALESVDTKTKFISDPWNRVEQNGSYGGGGLTRIFQNGEIFEKAGVNFSEVHGSLPNEMSHKLIGKNKPANFYATGISLVIHPRSPLIPTTHANFRYLEVEDKSWFGGGIDLTPYYLFEEDAQCFHQTLKNYCNKHDNSYYPKFKEWCDQYFYLPHRGETRGIGGLFFDYLGKEEGEITADFFPFVSEGPQSFIDCYLPIVNNRKNLTWTEEQKHFQLLRRGRYVEFNLLYDRGTQFGLQTGGRTESILMSLPPEVIWEYNYTPEQGSAEEKLIETLKSPRSWL
jgi:coproporphyrinogen III oxidase